VIWTIAWIALGILAVTLILAVLYVLWLSYSLLSPWKGDPFGHLPEHTHAIEKARYEYEIAEELDYPGEVLLGLESKICAERARSEAWAKAKAEREAAQPATETAEPAPNFVIFSVPEGGLPIMAHLVHRQHADAKNKSK
jgi:hypothetical protein